MTRASLSPASPLLLLCGLLCVGLACSAPPETPPAPRTDGGGSSAAGCAGAVPTTLEQLWSRYLQERPQRSGGCALGGCHRAGAGGLRFATAAEFAQAVINQPSAAGAPLVKPGDPSASALYTRLTAQQMPPGGPFLDAAQLAEVAGWICAGAPLGPPSDMLGGDAATAPDLGPLCEAGASYCAQSARCVPAGGCCTSAECAPPRTCGGGSTANVCGCTPTTCAAQGKNCGAIPDGCGGSLACGSCTPPRTCGGGGTANVCGCTPTTCAAQGKNCGTLSDGCGGTLSCGACMAPKTCGGGGTANVCGVGVCPPTTCAAQGKNCGTISDGCGGSLSCGACTAPQTCGGGGTANVCGCTPTTCAAQGKNCGSISDGCGGTLACGTCAGSQVCSNNVCQCGATVSLAAQVQPILTASCASNGCHTGMAPAQGLNLGSGKAFANLVNVASSQCAGKIRVVPGGTANSYLINKITGVSICTGTQMPKGAPLSQAQIDLISGWVCQGAPNN